MTGYLPVGFEFAAELTYPEPEVTSSGLLNASAQVFGIVFTIIGGWLLNSYGDLVCNGSLSAALFFGAALSLFIRSDLKRQRANQMEALRVNEALNQVPIDSGLLIFSKSFIGYQLVSNEMSHICLWQFEQVRLLSFQGSCNVNFMSLCYLRFQNVASFNVIGCRSKFVAIRHQS